MGLWREQGAEKVLIETSPDGIASSRRLLISSPFVPLNRNKPTYVSPPHRIKTAV